MKYKVTAITQAITTIATISTTNQAGIFFFSVSSSSAAARIPGPALPEREPEKMECLRRRLGRDHAIRRLRHGGFRRRHRLNGLIHSSGNHSGIRIKIRPVKDHHNILTKGNHIPGAQLLGTGDPLPIEESPIGGAQILDDNVIFLHQEPGMPAGNFRVADGNVICQITAQENFLFFKGIGFPGVGPERIG